MYKIGKQAVSGVLQIGRSRAVLSTACAVILGGVYASELQAQTTTYWADWTMPTNYSLNLNGTFSGSKYATGTTGSINNNGSTVNLTLTGEVNDNSVNNNSSWYGSPYNPASAFTDSTGVDNVGNGPNGTDWIAQTGHTAPVDKAHTLTFGGVVQDVVMAMYSLGSPTIASLPFL